MLTNEPHRAKDHAHGALPDEENPWDRKSPLDPEEEDPLEES